VSTMLRLEAKVARVRSVANTMSDEALALDIMTVLSLAERELTRMRRLSSTPFMPVRPHVAAADGTAGTVG
jgi:hypothetical protein